MPLSVRHILWCILLLGFTSMVYFLSLPAHLSIWATAIIIAAYGVLSYRWMATHLRVHEGPPMSRGDVVRAYAVFFLGLAVLIEKGYQVELEYGHWDAWWLWDYHAKYMQDPAYWRQLFNLNDDYHPDYPLFLSSVIAFVWRVMGTFDQKVPFVFSILVAVSVPCMIFLSLYRRNLIVASVAFLLLCFNTEFLTMALAQYADQPLAFLFLGAFISLEYAREHRQAIVVVAALLGCCVWMKNEGLMLAAIFTAFHWRALLAGGNAKRFIAGIALPLCVYAFLKLNAPANDLVKGQSATTLANLTDWSRYAQIGKHFYIIITASLLHLSIFILIYLLYCYTMRRWPGRNLAVLFTCVLGFAVVYLLTPHALTWHLSTSADRVLFQLVPSFIYVMARNFCELQLTGNAQEFQ